MAWNGWFTYGDTEIINATRTETYAQHAAVGWFKPVYRNDALPMILGDVYTSPLMDDAPWTDPDDLSSYDFYGAYPLDVVGIENSTVTANVVESTREGGVVQSARHATKTVVFSVALVGGSECAVEYGMRWLKTVLTQCGCLRNHSPFAACGSQSLTFLSCEPAVDLNYTTGTATFERQIVDGGTAPAPGPTPVNGGSAAKPGGQLLNGGGAVIQDTTTIETGATFDLTECFDPYLRTLHKVTITTGPAITQKTQMSNGGAAWIVEFTAVAGDPNEYGAVTPIVVGFLDPAVPVPYPGDLVPPGAMWDPDGYVTVDPPCPVVVYQPVFDPECPLLVPPPAVPTISPVCFTFPTNFTRRQFTIPKQDVALWNGTVPIITIHTPASAEVRNLRVRFFEDDDGDATIDEPCIPDGDVVFTYLPPDSIVTFDAVAHLIYVDTPNEGRRRADSIATDSDGGPFAWPQLACGCGYVVTVDMPQTQVLPVVDLSLVKKAC
jgi:hypothetical protein